MLRPLTSPTVRLLQPTANRLLHTTRPLQKENPETSQDRTALQPERSEGTLSGTDSEVAAHPSAYDPGKTSPESEIAAAEEESKEEGKTSNPLNMSAANQNVNRARDLKEGGADRNAAKAGPSSRGWTRKHRVVNEDKTK